MLKIFLVVTEAELGKTNPDGAVEIGRCFCSLGPIKRVITSARKLINCNSAGHNLSTQQFPRLIECEHHHQY